MKEFLNSEKNNYSDKSEFSKYLTSAKYTTELQNEIHPGTNL